MQLIHLAGHLGSDPVTRTTPSGMKVTSFSLAINIRRKDKDKDDTIWWRITVWGDRFDKMLTFLKKGSAVCVTGRMTKEPEIYTDKGGQPRVSLELTADMMEFPSFGRQDRNGEQQPQSSMGGTGMVSRQQAAPSHMGGGSFEETMAPYGRSQVMSGQSSQHIEAMEEEPLPF